MNISSFTDIMGRTKCPMLIALWLLIWAYINGYFFVQADQVPMTEDMTVKMEKIPYKEGYSTLFGDNNLRLAEDGKTIQLLLDKYTGSGFISQDLFLYGFFSASIKLPEDYTAGVVAAFYASNEDMFKKNHDELDFEFLGNIRGKEWRIQTNLYGNGSTSIGREERYTLWFDPTQDFHKYSILWNDKHIVFFVDNVPIREVVKTEGMGSQYPSKPMSVYATIWDGSDWATKGGTYKVNYKYAPFTATFTDLVLEGCTVNPIEEIPYCTPDIDSLARVDMPDFSILSAEQKAAMKWFRSRYISYSYCDDEARYPNPLPECPPRDRSRRNASRSDMKPGGSRGERRHKRHASRKRSIYTHHS
eukprot:Gb_33516 [translate_table: standard]